MSRETILMVLGICVLLSPFFGLPASWLARIDVVFGLVIAYLGYSLRSNK